jgi:hypothetical protein
MTPLATSSLRRLRTMPEAADVELPAVRPPLPVDA